MKRHTHFRWFVFAVLLGGCGESTHTFEQQSADSALSAQELGFGLPGKTDQVCDAQSALCWTAQDTQTMRRILATDDQFRTAEASPDERLDELYASFAGLKHKMTEQEQVHLQQLASQGLEDLNDAAARARVSHDIFGVALERIVGGYLTAHAVPLGQLAQSHTHGKSDTVAFEAVEVLSTVLADLSLHGPFHAYVAMMLHSTGALEPLPSPHRDTFPYVQPLEELARQITHRYTTASVAQGAVGQALTFVPVVGVALGVPYGLMTQFRLRARMILELVALHGIDPRTTHGLQIAVAVLGAATEMPDASEAVIDAIAAHRAHSSNPHSTPADRAHTHEMIGLALRRIGAASGKIMARIQLKAAAKAGRSSILGYATLGLATIGELVLESVLTSRIGWRARVMTRPWAQESLRTESNYLFDETIADCVHACMGYMLPNNPSEDAARFIAAHLDRAVFQDGWQSAFSVSAVEAALEQMRAARTDQSIPTCVSEDFNQLKDEELLHILSWLGVIGQLQGGLTEDTESRLAEIMSTAKGGWASGLGIHPATVMMNQVKHTFAQQIPARYGVRGLHGVESDLTWRVRDAFALESTPTVMASQP